MGGFGGVLEVHGIMSNNGVVCSKRRMCFN